MGRTVGILLALSLAANVFLGGFVAGRIAGPNLPGFDHSRDKGRPGHLGGGERQDFDDLPPAVREKLKSAFRQNRREFAAAFREGRALRDEFVSTLTAETFDRAAAEAVAAKIDAFETDRRRSMPRVIIDVMDGLPVEDRRALAALVERRMIEEMAGPGRRRHGREGRGGPPPDGPSTE